jgi:hypothetical protein
LQSTPRPARRQMLVSTGWALRNSARGPAMRCPWADRESNPDVAGMGGSCINRSALPPFMSGGLFSYESEGGGGGPVRVFALAGWAWLAGWRSVQQTPATTFMPTRTRG